MSKAFFTDLDETLLTKDKKICPENKRAIGQLLNQGNIFVVATGRTIRGSKAITEELGLKRKNCYMVLFNGSMLYDCEKDRILHTDSLRDQDVIELMKALKKAEIYCHTYNPQEILMFEPGETFERYNAVTKEPYRRLASPEELRGQTMPKVMSIDYEDHAKLAEFQASYRKGHEGIFTSFFSNPNFLEFVPKGCDKAHGMEKLLQLLGLDLSDAVAIGDERNDLSMIQRAGIGVCMGNGRPEVKEQADYVTVLDNDQGGVAEAIERFVLN